jgi:hypothetical protein
MLPYRAGDRPQTAGARSPVGVAYAVEVLYGDDGMVLEVMSKMCELLKDFSSSSRDETPKTNAR